MKKFLIFLIIFLGNILTNIFYASSWDIQFGIDKITVVDDKTLSILFNKPLAKEPINLQIYDSSGWALWVLNIQFPKFNAENNEVVVTVWNKIQETSTYKVLVISALSVDGDKLNQTDIKDSTILETWTWIVVTSFGQSLSSEDLTKLFQENLNNDSNGNNNSNSVENTKSSTDTWWNNNKNISSNFSNKPIIATTNNNNNNNNDNINNNNSLKTNSNIQSDISNSWELEAKKLPKTWPETIYLFLLTLVLVFSYFTFLRFKKWN